MEIAVFIGVFVLLQKILEKLNLKIPQKTLTIGLNAVIVVGSMVLAFALYSLLNGKYCTGLNMFIIPFLISILGFIALIKIWKTDYKEISTVIETNVSFKAMLSSSVPIVTLLLASYAFKLLIYAPSVFNVDSHFPAIAVTLYILLICLFSLSSIYDMKVNNSSLNKTITFALITFSIYQTFLYCLTLMYGLTNSYEVSYTLWSGILSVSFIPIIISLMKINSQDLNCNKNV